MKRSGRRAFGLSLGISLFVFLTAAGCVAVDYQGRKMTFGDSRPPLEVVRLPGGQARLEARLFGAQGSWDVTGLDRALGFVCDFLCLPHP